MTVGLPTTLTVDGIEREINTDFRDVINIFVMLNDDKIPEIEKGILLVGLLYKDDVFEFGNIKEAMEQARWFLDCGKEWKQKGNAPKLLDWEQDYSMIISAVDKNIKTAETCLELPYLHWWTFINKFTERGECQLSTVVGIREKMSKGKKLEKYEEEMLRENRDVIVIKNKINLGDWWDDE